MSAAPAPAPAPVEISRRRSAESSSQRNRYVRSLTSVRALIGLSVLGAVVLAGLLAPVIAPDQPNEQIFAPLAHPSMQHLLGTDELGRDLLTRVLYGVRIDVLVGVLGVTASAVAGTALGLAGASYRRLDGVVNRTFDVLLAFPALLMGLALAVVFGPGIAAIVLTIVLSNVPLFGRLTRNSARQQRARDYVVAARVVGCSPRRVLARHVLPNVVDPLVVQWILAMSTAVFIEGGMSFVGIGVQAPTPSLGNMLNGSLPYLYTSPTYAAGPIIAVCALVLSLNLIGQSVNDALLRR